MANPRHSAESARAIQRSKDLSLWIFDNTPTTHTFASPPKNDPEALRAADLHRKRHSIAMSLFQIALDHHTAIVHLCIHHMRSSAFALSRCMFDAAWKGAWMAFAASDLRVEEFAAGHFEPKATSCMKPLEQALGEVSFFTKAYAQAWTTLCDYNHSGLRQVLSWWAEGEIASQHTDEEMERILGLCDQLAMFCAFFVVQLCDGDGAAAEAKFKEVFGITG